MGSAAVGPAPGRAPALAAHGITKRFAGVRALDRAGVAVAPGEVHALLGQNGSGKSTLVKVLAGFHAPEPGGVLAVDGRPVSLPLRPGEPARLGLSFVHQDLGLIPSLSVLENLRLAELATSRRWFISWRRERRRARETLVRLGIELDPSAVVGRLAPVERAQVAIARAVEALEGRPAGASGVLVLDEPAAYLPPAERRRLFALVRESAAGGVGVLLVSHDLEEALALARRITVLRDGRNVGTVAASETDAARLAELILGHAPTGVAAGGARGSRAAPAAVTVAGLAGAGVRDVSFAARTGEVLGLTGLAGSGFDEVPYLLYGARRGRGGRLTLGRTYDLAAMTPHRALRAGIALLPGDRLRDGGAASLSLEANVTLPVLGRYASRHRLDRRRMRQDAGGLLERYGVRPADPGASLGALSGGNQQKALLAKWIGAEPRLLLLDEPARGVDVGAREAILAAIRGLAQAGGMTVICASAEAEDLSLLCDRVLVFGDGKVAGELAGAEVTEARIAELCQAAAPRGARR